MFKRPLDRRKGQGAVMITLALIPMFGALGLVTDLGWMYYVKKSAQAAADSAAMAAIIQFHATVSGSKFTCGAPGVYCQSQPLGCQYITSPNNLENGCLYANQNGFSDGGKSGKQSVTMQAGVTAPPPTAPGVQTASYWVTVRVSERVPQLFSAVTGNTTGMVVARATAAIAPSNNCIYALDPSAASAVTVGGTATLQAACGIYVDSNNATALTTNGTANLSATEYNIVGGYSVQTPLTPDPNTGVPPQSDPLASMQAPAVPSGCDYTGTNVTGWNTVTLYPGVYCGGIHVGNGTAIFSPGTYILKGGGLSTQSANSTIQGTGVTFYNTYGPGYPYQGIDLNANSNVTLSAPTSGTYEAILFFQDRTVSGLTSDNFGGGSSAKYEGTIYMPKSQMTFSGNASLNAAYTIIVADTVSLIGTSYMGANYSSLPGGSPIKTVAMVE